MAHVTVRSNGKYNGDTVEVAIDGHTTLQYTWHEMNPRALVDVLESCGCVVTWDEDAKFDHDGD